MLKLLKTATAFLFIAGISSAVGQQISGGGGGGGGGTPGGSNTQIQYNNSGAFGGALLRYSSANFFLGDVDAASPVAQTISPQNVVTGTSNTAGADWTIAGSKGTGTGAGGSVVFQTAKAGSTGSSQNALATAFTVGGDGDIYFGASGANQTRITTIFGGGHPNLMLMTAAGASKAYISESGWTLLNGASLGWGSNPSGTFAAGWTRSADAVIQQGDVDQAAPVAQTYQVQSVSAGTSNIAGTDWTLNGSRGTGTGVGGNIILQTAPASTTGTSQNALSQVAIVDSKSHIRVGNTTAPALTSCGTSPSIVGTDVAGTVTMGTTATGCVITFKIAYANAPICNVTWRATPLASQSYAISTTAITTTQTSANNNVLDYHCFAQNAG